MRYEFARLHQRLKTTTIYVTHDQVEAMTLADRIAILDRGEIDQFGTAEELYQRPASRFVAGFIGSPQMNFLEAKLDRGRQRPRGGQTAQRTQSSTRPSTLGGPSPATRSRSASGPSILGASSTAGLPATVALIEWLGNMHFAYVTTEVSDEPLIMQLPAGQKLDEGRVDHDRREPEDCHLFDADGRAFPRAAHSPDSHGRLRRPKHFGNEPLAVSR